MNRSARVASVLDTIVAAKRAEVVTLRPSASSLRRAAEAVPPARGLGKALRQNSTVAVISEVKRRSPSAGWIREGADVATIARGYEAAGAAAISVLTDAEWFGGSLDDLRAVRAAVAVPVLRKDFVVDPVQVWEARAAGADAVLLIVRILDDRALRTLLDVAREAGLDALVEVHDERELARALAAGATIVGVNNRDLAVFRTDLAVTERLAPGVPSGVVLVAESGIATAAEVDRLGAVGVDAVLVGESLMREPDPGAAAQRLVGRARAARV